ncbi:MAG: Peptidoglycan hydrolase FlgJ [Variovorax sp.]|nr:MAG: Peptidoglycan hydrolase FlgJ [Variovorax sp.]
MSMQTSLSAMSMSPSTGQGLAADARSLDALKLAANGNDPKAVREAAKQFESLFMRELIKSMREATMKSGLLDSDGEKLGTDLLDQQFAVQLSGLPGGLTDAITRQLTQQMSGTAKAPTIALGAEAARIKPAANQRSFVEQHDDAAERVSRETGIPASFMIGQAGHETGWGRSEIRHRDGSPSHNLFGIKAGGSWTGPTVAVTTTEYIGGEPRKVTARFRAYDSYEESFRDYARLIGNSPRYEKARASVSSVSAYASELYRAGYATDPAYAAKLSRAIHTTLKIQRT